MASACGDDQFPCGDGTTRDGSGRCVADPHCGPGTVEQDGQCVAESPLEPGHYQAPLVQLQRLQGTESHMHVAQVKYRASDSKLFYCSYTFGMIDAADPQNMRYRAQGLRHQTPSGSPRAPGCLHLAWDETNPNIVYTSHRGNIDFARFLSGWDLTNVAAPAQLPALQESNTRYGGLDVENGLIYVALQEGGLGIYSYDPVGRSFTRLGTAAGLANAWSVIVHEHTAYVADGVGGLATVDVTDPAAPVLLGRVVFGGNAEELAVEGTVAYVAAGSAGLVIVDVSNPASPSVISSVAIPGSAVGVAYSAGRAYVAGWNDVRAFDVSTPGAPSFIGATRLTTEQAYQVCTGSPEVCVPDDLRPDPTARTLAVAAHDDTLFIGNWWVPYSFQVHADRKAPYLVLPEDVALVDFGPAAPGEARSHELLVRNDGTAPLTLYSNYASAGAFQVSPPQVRIQPGESTTIKLGFTPSRAEMERGLVTFLSDDPGQPRRDAYVLGNRPGLGVGKPLPETVATLLDGTTYSTAPLTGSVQLLAYFATF